MTTSYGNLPLIVAVRDIPESHSQSNWQHQVLDDIDEEWHHGTIFLVRIDWNSKMAEANRFFKLSIKAMTKTTPMTTRNKNIMHG
jgi:hypothetical protein